LLGDGTIPSIDENHQFTNVKPDITFYLTSTLQKEEPSIPSTTPTFPFQSTRLNPHIHAHLQKVKLPHRKHHIRRSRPRTSKPIPTLPAQFLSPSTSLPAHSNRQFKVKMKIKTMKNEEKTTDESLFDDDEKEEKHQNYQYSSSYTSNLTTDQDHQSEYFPSKNEIPINANSRDDRIILKPPKNERIKFSQLSNEPILNSDPMNPSSVPPAPHLSSIKSLSKSKSNSSTSSSSSLISPWQLNMQHLLNAITTPTITVSTQMNSKKKSINHSHSRAPSIPYSVFDLFEFEPSPLVQTRTLNMNMSESSQPELESRSYSLSPSRQRSRTNSRNNSRINSPAGSPMTKSRSLSPIKTSSTIQSATPIKTLQSNILSSPRQASMSPTRQRSSSPDASFLPSRPTTAAVVITKAKTTITSQPISPRPLSPVRRTGERINIKIGNINSGGSTSVVETVSKNLHFDEQKTEILITPDPLTKLPESIAAASTNEKIDDASESTKIENDTTTPDNSDIPPASTTDQPTVSISTSIANSITSSNATSRTASISSMPPFIPIPTSASVSTVDTADAGSDSDSDSSSGDSYSSYSSYTSNDSTDNKLEKSISKKQDLLAMVLESSGPSTPAVNTDIEPVSLAVEPVVTVDPIVEINKLKIDTTDHNTENTFLTGIQTEDIKTMSTSLIPIEKNENKINPVISSIADKLIHSASNPLVQKPKIRKRKINRKIYAPCFQIHNVFVHLFCLFFRTS
jgi:hypothetical protein